MGLKETTQKVIDRIFDNEKKQIIEEISSGDRAQELFELFVLIVDSQTTEYSKLFETAGFLPKNYVDVVVKLFGNYVHETFLRNPTRVEGIENLLSEAFYLAQNYEDKAPIFVQIKTFVDGQLKETTYGLTSATYSWSPGRGFSPFDKGVNFKTKAIPIGTDIEIKTRRVPCPFSLLVSLLMKVLDDDNWEIQEVDPIEHFQGQAFLWDKAFGSLFAEVNNGTGN